MASERDKLLRQWFESTPKAWRENEHRKEREVLFGILQPDENIVATIVGIFDSYGHHLSPNICLMAATTERVLLLRRGRSDARDSAEFSFDTFESVTGKAGMIEGEIKLIARQPHNDVRMLSIRPKDSATYFAVSLEKLLGEHLRSQGIMPTPNRRDRILKQWLEVMPKGWGTFGDDGMHKGERGMLIDIVDDDEDVLALVGGTFRADTNRIHKHNGIAVATTKRILFLDKGVLGSKEVMEIGYRNIEAITYSTGMLMGGIQITGLGTAGFRIEDIRPKESNKPFADCVRQLIDQAREQDLSSRQAETVGQLSSADELQKLVSLLQDGHITPEEFATMKSRIIQGK